MFHNLVASGPRGSWDLERVLWSATAHVIIVGAAIVLSRRSSPVVFTEHSETAVVLPPLPPRAKVTAEPSVRQGTGSRTPVLDPLRIPDVSLPVLPPALPGVAELLRDAALGRTGGREPAADGGRLDAADEPWSAASVDDPVEILEQPPVRYPPGLAQAGIVGRVELEYVVDTTGRAEAGTVRTLTTTHPEFAAAARTTVLGSRYRPARLRGTAVRQLVRQSFRFRAPR